MSQWRFLKLHWVSLLKTCYGIPAIPCLVFSRKEPTFLLCFKPNCAQVFPDSPGCSIRHHFYASSRSTRNNMGRPELCRNTCKQKNATKLQRQLEFPPLAVLMNSGQADLRAAAAMLQPRAGGREHSTNVQESTWLHSDHASRSGTELPILPSVSQKAAGGHCLKNTPVLPCCLQIQGASPWHPAISSLPTSDL